MDPKNFYYHLWQYKENNDSSKKNSRDWFHRYFLDLIFNPFINTRQEVALSLLKEGHRLLDIGCWDGGFLERVRSSGRFHELGGIDIVAEGVEKARGKGLNVEMVDLNTSPLPYEDSFFNCITILGVLEHVFDPYKVLDEIYRVLEPGGQFIIAVPNVASFTNRIRILLGRMPVTSNDPGWDGGHLHYFTKYDLDRLLDSKGFDIVARRTSGGRARLREMWISLLAGQFIYSCLRR